MDEKSHDVSKNLPSASACARDVRWVHCARVTGGRARSRGGGGRAVTAWGRLGMSGLQGAHPVCIRIPERAWVRDGTWSCDGERWTDVREVLCPLRERQQRASCLSGLVDQQSACENNYIQISHDM